MEKTLLIEATTGGVAPIQVLDFNTKGNNLKFFYEHVECETIDIVAAHGLEGYAGLEGICLVVDDEGLFKEDRKVNIIGSLLYGLLNHGQPIVGNVLVCKDKYTEDGTETVGLTYKDIFLLDRAISDLIEAYNKEVERRRNA